MAEFTEIIRQRNYMCDHMENCKICPIYKDPSMGANCRVFMTMHPMKAEYIISNWYKANKPKTNRDMLIKVFGADIADGLPSCAGFECPQPVIPCDQCPHENFWEQEYKENKQ